jgi:hypothetical protein
MQQLISIDKPLINSISSYKEAWDEAPPLLQLILEAITLAIGQSLKTPPFSFATNCVRG